MRGSEPKDPGKRPEALEDLERVVMEHARLLRIMRTYCARARRDPESLGKLEMGIRRIRGARSAIREGLGKIEKELSRVSLGEEAASDLVVMAYYIEMSATRDEARYLRIASKILARAGLSPDLRRDLEELDEIARIARRISEAASRA